MAKLDFPADPVLDQEYHFTPFTYRWDGEKWKTIGRGSDPVEDAIDEHKADSKAHDPELIGALPSNGTGKMTGPLTIETETNEAITLKYPAGKDGGYLRGREDGALDWYIGRANTSGHVAMYSDKLENGIVIRDSYIETVKPLRMGQSFVYLYNQRAGTTNLNDIFSSGHCGMYYQDSSAGATPALNYPIAEAGTLLVSGSAYGAQQEYTTYSSYRKFIRGQSAAGGKSWFPWKEIGGAKHHMSGINFNPVVIPVSGNANLMPTMFPSYLGITMGDTVATVSRDGKYRIDWGFSVEPANLDQQAVGSIFVNSVETYPSIIYNYTPTNTAAVQMTISSTSLIVTLKAGDRLQFNVKSVNSKTARIFRAGHIVIQEL